MEWFNKLRAHRIIRGWKLGDVEQRTGISKPNISKLERGMIEPNRKQMIIFCELYNAEAQYLFFDDSDRLG